MNTAITSTVDQLQEKGEKAATLCLTRRGYEILETGWTCLAGRVPIIAWDEDGAMVFVDVKTRRADEGGFYVEANPAAARSRFEEIALAYLSDFDDVDFGFRFDLINIVALSDDRAVIRHEIGAYSTR